MPVPNTAPPSPPDMGSVLGKRHHEADDAIHDRGPERRNDHEIRPYKRGKGRVVTELGVSEAGGSTNRTHQKPATGTLVDFHGKSKAVRRGAERLAPPNAQGVYHGFLQGPSLLQESMGTIAQERQPWVEGSAEAAMWHRADGAMQEQQEIYGVNDGEFVAAEDRHLFYFTRRLSNRHSALLVATPADWARGAVPALKCRLCPSAGFSNWDDFKRHCDAMEAHPLEISFCDRCGDFFARRDSLERHCKNRPPRCLDVSPDQAEVKRRETARVHREFQERLEECLRSGGDIGLPFAQIVKKMYPTSTKRLSRQQNRLREPKKRT